MAGKTRVRNKSPLTDNVRPGSPTTMDVLLEWLTTPGNVKRWRTESRGPLVRELVSNMQEAGLAHRNAPFVRYKVDALEKHYLTAKQWLLETGMHDSFMRGKASKDIKAQVDKVCPQFLTLDPAFRGVPFSSKNAEMIELDGDSAEDAEEKNAESEEVEELEASGGEEVEGSASSEESEEEKKEVDEAPQKEKSEAPKRNTFRDRLVAAVVEKDKPAAETPSERSTESKEKKPKAKHPKKKAPTPTEPKKKALPSKEPALTSAVKVALAQTIEVVKPKPQAKPSTREKRRSSLTKQVTEAEPAKATEGSPAPAAKRRGRSPKSATAVAAQANGVKETEPKASEQATSPAAQAAKRKHSEEEAAVKRARTQEADEANRKVLREIERKALLKRVADEQTQRHEMFGLERAKMQCELEAKQVQVLFEKAAARKKLDQLGIAQGEIDRIIPL